MKLSTNVIFPAVATMSLALTGGCSEGEAAGLPSCTEIREQAMSLWADKEIKVIKIYEPKETYRSDLEVHCSGRAAWSDTTEAPIYYRLTTDEEGDQFVEAGPEAFAEPQTTTEQDEAKK